MCLTHGSRIGAQLCSGIQSSKDEHHTKALASEIFADDDANFSMKRVKDMGGECLKAECEEAK